MSAARDSTVSASMPSARSCRLIWLRICRCRSSFCCQSTKSVNGVTASSMSEARSRLATS